MAEECEKNTLFECNNWFALIIYFLVAAMVLILLLLLYAVFCNLFGARFARRRFKYTYGAGAAGGAGSSTGRSSGSMAPPPYQHGSSSEGLPPYNPNMHPDPSSGRTTPASKYSLHTNGSQYARQGGPLHAHYAPSSVHSGGVGGGPRSTATSSVGGHNRSMDVSSVSMEYNTAV